jgi:hypothetical protein
VLVWYGPPSTLRGGADATSGQVKPPVEPWLSDRIPIRVLTSTFPPGLVDRVVSCSGSWSWTRARTASGVRAIYGVINPDKLTRLAGALREHS